MGVCSLVELRAYVGSRLSGVSAPGRWRKDASWRRRRDVDVEWRRRGWVEEMLFQLRGSSTRGGGCRAGTSLRVRCLSVGCDGELRRAVVGVGEGKNRSRKILVLCTKQGLFSHGTNVMGWRVGEKSPNVTCQKSTSDDSDCEQNAGGGG